MTYEQACMSTPKDKYYTKLLETAIDYNNHHNAPLSDENLKQAIYTVMAETEKEEFDAKRNSNNVTIYTLCQSPDMTNTQGNILNVPNERRISSNIMAETIKGFKELTIQSTVNNYLYYHSKEDDASAQPL